MLANVFRSGRALVKKFGGTVDAIPHATDAEAFEAFDHTCRYYLDMSAREFLDRWKAGKIPADTPHLSRVLDLLSLVK